MPAFVTHELFGKELFRRFPPKLRELLNRNPAPYFWGLQGPDLLFFRDPLREKSRLPHYGNMLHSQSTDELFSILSGYVSSHGFTHYSHREKQAFENFERHYISVDTKEYETLLSYSIGFIGHYILDSNTHPYIFWLQNKNSEKLPLSHQKGVHSRIESDIDSVLYKTYSNRTIHQYSPAHRLYGSKREYRIIAKLYQFLLMDLHGVDISAAEITKCFYKAKKIVTATMDPLCGGMLALAECYDFISGKPNTVSTHVRRTEVKEDVLNEQHRLWHNLQTCSAPVNTSFLELMDNAIPQGVLMSCEFYNATVQAREFSPHGLPSFDNGTPEK